MQPQMFATVERHAHLIQLYLTLEFSYELPDLDKSLASQNSNPHRDQLCRLVESSEFKQFFLFIFTELQ